MILGRFGDTSGRPYVTAHVELLRLGVEGEISFLVDTGADSTVIMPLDAKRLGIEYSELSDPADSFGVGGKSSDYLEPGMVAFGDDNGLYGYHLGLIIMKPKEGINSTPSLLGRDILQNWDMRMSKPDNMIQFKVIHSHIRV